MSNQELHSHFSELMSKYVSGNASAQEVAELEAWVLENSEHKQQFQAFKKAWMLTGMQREQAKVDVDAMWRQTSEQLFPQAKSAKVVDMKPRINRRLWFGIAAAVVALIVAVIWIFPSKDDSPLIVQTTDKIQSLTLSDGSQITLNQESSFRFEATEEGQRQVELTGDAYFEVARDEKRPFVIQAQEVEIEVLGTAFYVDAREGQSDIQVVVASGSVAVRAGGEEQVLRANEKATFQKDNAQLLKQANEDINFRALKTDTLIFEDAPMEEVVYVLNRRYRAKIRIENTSFTQCKLTGTYRNMSLNDILEVLQVTFEIEAKKQGEEIVLTGGGNC